MKILLAAVNSKYTHMNPAVYSIRAFAGEFAGMFEIAEYTINQFTREVLDDIYTRHPDVIGFSCYIWNMKFIGELLNDIKSVLPKTSIFLGGPEVSYNARQVMDIYPAVDGIFIGEGEISWKQAAAQLAEQGRISEHIDGLLLKGDDGSGANAPAVCMDDIPFIYTDLKPFANKMLYYETSRGCPFRCSYCLSSIDKCMKFRSLDKVFPELQFFLDNNVRIVKFIDRTFNANHEHAMSIWKYLKEHDNNTTRFHFEIEADLLTEQELEFLKGVRAGLFQFEIGVQSVNPVTLKTINRSADIGRIKHVVQYLAANGNIPLHTDLIAGLPFENLESFKKSFNEVYSWGADELQLGFLKVLHGTQMEEKAGEYGLISETRPPYEVIASKWISFDDVLFLKRIEEQLEVYGNSGAFEKTIRAFERLFDTPFDMYRFIADYYKEHAAKFSKQSRISRYEMLYGAIECRLDESDAADGPLKEMRKTGFQAMLAIDLYSKEKLKVRPQFLENAQLQRDVEREYVRSHETGTNVHVEVCDINAEIFAEEGKCVPEKCMIVFCYEGQGAARSKDIIIG